MKRHPDEEKLNDLVDGLLSEPERPEIEDHVARCDECREIVNDLRSLLQQASVLADRRPDRDLLPGIRAKVSPSGTSRAQWLALAASLIAVAAAAAWWLMPAPPAETGAMAVHANPDRAWVAGFRAADHEYVEAANELLAVVDLRRDRLPAGTVADLENNLAVLDHAIGEARLVMESDEADPNAGRMLTTLHQKRMHLLWRVARLSSRA